MTTIDNAAYQQGFTQAINGGTARALIESIDFASDDSKAEAFGVGPSKLIGFLDGLLQRFAILKP